VCFVAHKLSPFGAESRHLGGIRLVVQIIAVITSADVCRKNLLPEITLLGVLEERKHTRFVQSEDPLPLVPPFGRRFGGARPDRLRQPG